MADTMSVMPGIWQEDHQRIFAAIMGRDPAAAREAMQAHLSRVVGESTQAWR
jgi:DNA-binding FadR family transcriptional regulator